VPFVQGQYLKKILTCHVETECGHCGEPIHLELDSELNFRIGEGEEFPLVYSPMIAIHALEPSIIDGF
jgi:hypothetical protein